MLPKEFLEIINALPPDERAAYEKDLLFFGRGYVKMDSNGQYHRIDPKDINEQEHPR